MGASAEGGSECGERERVREAGASAGANYEAYLKIEYLTDEVETCTNLMGSVLGCLYNTNYQVQH